MKKSRVFITGEAELSYVAMKNLKCRSNVDNFENAI